MANLAGLYPPIPTPFDAAGRVALDHLERNLAAWASSPLDGVVMPGSNSEAAFLSPQERTAIWRCCGESLRRSGQRLIAGTGAETTEETIALTVEAAELGAIAALVLPPFFYKASMTHEALVAHFRAVADASPIPLLVYNVPAFTGIDFTVDTLRALAEHPQIVGMKDSSANVVKVAQVLADRPDWQVFVGSGGALLPFLSLGGAGAIAALANIAAAPLRQLMDSYERGELGAARVIQLRLAPLNSAITAQFGVSGLKYAMDQVGLYGGPVRRPLLPLSEKAMKQIDHLLRESGLGAEK